MRVRRLLSLFAAVGLTACGGGGDGDADRDAGPPTDGGPSTDATTPADGGCVGPHCIPDETEDCTPEELAGTSFCDPATWGGAAPDADTDVLVSAGMNVVVDCDATAGAVTVEPGATLRASRDVSSTLTVHGNLVVRGHLDWGRPGCRVPEGVRAEIVFAGMDDAAYAGTPSTVFGSERGPSADTPMEVLDSDLGLWVIDDGTLVAAGTAKRAWSRLLEGAGPGDPTFRVEDATGWQPGDRVVLTPTAPREDTDHTEQFDEGLIAAVDGDQVTLDAAPSWAHAGCDDGCLRRGEAANLTRNVVIRSADDTAHAHVMIAHRAHATLDSVELRWLGPEQCGGPERRAPLYFHQQDDASTGSAVRHTAIWGGQKHSLMVERSHGIEIADVVGYDSYSTAFALFYDNSACGTRCTDRESAPRDTVLRSVLAAKIGVGQREEGCLRVQHRMAGLVVSGGEGSGAEDSVATGIGWTGGGADVAGFTWAEGGSGRPTDFVFSRNVAHNNGNHGAFIWHNGANAQEPYDDNELWSNDGFGVHWGAYNNAFVLRRFVAVDNGLSSVGVKAVPRDDRPRLDTATLDDLEVLAYVLVQDRPNILRNLTFTGARPLAFRQIHDVCESGDPNDPADPDCTRIWLRIESPRFASGVRPFDFGWTFNFHSVWEVRDFEHPDAEYADLPADFDLYRADNEVEGGAYDARFDAWLVPR